VPVLPVAVLLPVVGLLVGLLVVPVVAGHLGVSPELAAFGASVVALVVVVGLFGALLRDFHLWRQMRVPKRV